MSITLRAAALGLLALLAGAQSARAQETCAAASGGTAAVAGTGEAICRELYDSGDAPRLRVFAAEGHAPQDAEAMAPIIAAAAERSMGYYSRFGGIPDVDIVYVDLAHPGGREMYGTAVGFPEELCKVGLYQPALEALARRRSSERGSDVEDRTLVQAVEFTVAHELFHCVQIENLFASYRADGSAWWREGSAEYYASLVYPDHDFEHGRALDFSVGVVTTPLVLMRHESYVLFQFLENSGMAPGEIYGFLQGAPTVDGEQAQRDFLAEQPGFEDAFHSFSQAFYDGEIYDSGGKRLPLTIMFPPLLEIDESDRYTTEVVPLTFGGRSLTMRDAREISLMHVFERGEGRHSERPDDARSWSRLPPLVVLSCGAPRETLLALTSIDPDADVVEFHIDAEVVQRLATGRRDQCLVGRWSVDGASVERYLEQWLESAGGVSTAELAGDAVMTLEADGDGILESAQTSGRTVATIGEQTMEVRTLVRATSRFTWSTGDGDAIYVCPVDEEITYDYEAYLDGDRVDAGDGVPFPAGPAAAAGEPTARPSAAVAGATRYDCAGGRATLHTTPPGLDATLPVVLERRR